MALSRLTHAEKQVKTRVVGGGTSAVDIADEVLLCAASAGLLLPPLASVLGLAFTVVKLTEGTVVRLTPDGAELINGASTYDIPAQYQSVMIVAGAAGWYVVADGGVRAAMEGPTLAPPPLVLPAGNTNTPTVSALSLPTQGWVLELPALASAYSRAVFDSGFGAGDWTYTARVRWASGSAGFMAGAVVLSTADNLFVCGLFGPQAAPWIGRWNAAGTAFIDQVTGGGFLVSCLTRPTWYRIAYTAATGGIVLTILPDGYLVCPETLSYATTGAVAYVGIGGQGSSGPVGGGRLVLDSAQLTT